MRRDEDFKAVVFCCFEQALEITDSIVFGDTVTDQFPGGTLFAQKIVLRVCDQDRCVAAINIHRNTPLVDCFSSVFLMVITLRRKT